MPSPAFFAISSKQQVMVALQFSFRIDQSTPSLVTVAVKPHLKLIAQLKQWIFASRSTRCWWAVTGDTRAGTNQAGSKAHKTRGVSGTRTTHSLHLSGECPSPLVSSHWLWPTKEFLLVLHTPHPYLLLAPWNPALTYQYQTSKSLDVKCNDCKFGSRRGKLNLRINCPNSSACNHFLNFE